MTEHTGQHFYECSGCGANVPVTKADPDPVIVVPGPRKFEWVFLCRACDIVPPKLPKKAKATKLTTPEPPGGLTIKETHPLRAAEFSDKHVAKEAFDMLVRDSGIWLQSAASLLRASRALLEQFALDGARRRAKFEAIEKGAPVSEGPAPIHYQALLLAALAVENAIKAVIAERGPVASPAPVQKLPGELSGHDLVDLALRAGIAPTDNHEEEALKRGENITEWLGRYPTPVAYNQFHSTVSVVPDTLHAAYERLFFRCVEEVSRRVCERYSAGSHKGVEPEGFAKEERARYEAMLRGIGRLGCEP